MYIKDLKCISAQPTFEGDFFEKEPVIYDSLRLMAVEPTYEEIPRGQLRRMGRSNRMATGAGMPLLQNWKVDGIIIGTSDGGMEDCHKFLNQIIEYQEGTLTPTGFVQGSPSSVAGGLALMGRNSGYNNTHSNEGLSFENALMDATLLFEEGRVSYLLVGCVEEISDAPFRIAQLVGHVKQEAVSTDRLLESKTPGSLKGEGAAMFVLSTDKVNALAQIMDVDMISYPTEDELREKAVHFLERNNLRTDDVDRLMLGYSGDGNCDHWYDDIVGHFPKSGILTYKNLFGENASASAFGIWLSTHVLNGKTPPEMTVLRSAETSPKNILIYNNYYGNQHGFVLVRAVAK